MTPLFTNTVLFKRIHILQILICGAFFVLGCQLWRLQILHGEEYRQLAERNRSRKITIPAPRGIIRDREGRTFASNRPAFNIVLIRENLKNLESTLIFLETELHINREHVLSRMRRFEKTPLFRPIIIKEDVSWSDLGIIESHAKEYPELGLTLEPRRFYPFGAWAAHVLGYVGEVSVRQLKSAEFANADPGDIVGKQGIERFYDSTLTGIDGQSHVIVNNVGRIIQEVERIEPVPGKDIQLTLDLDLQLVAEKAMEEWVGALVAMDPNNGEILAMVSRPAFDPNSFTGRISIEDWEELIKDPASPFMNRAIQASYSPGSIFKIIMAYAGLEEGLIKRTDWVFCNGSLKMNDHVFHCSHRGGHGFVNVNLAIQNSCNVFFYHLGKQMGIDTIARYARRMGFGERTQIDLPDERSGVVPDPFWKKKKYGSRWYIGETISVSIGQGALSATPLQIATAISAVATGGNRVRPHLRMDPLQAQRRRTVITRTAYLPENREILRDAMWRVVNSSGTGTLAAVSGLDICGKTGTVQVIGKERRALLKLNERGIESAELRRKYKDHAWFVGFAPKNAPDVAVAVFLEHGGKGGDTAAPIAAQVIREYFRKRKAIRRDDPRIARVQTDLSRDP